MLIYMEIIYTQYENLFGIRRLKMRVALKPQIDIFCPFERPFEKKQIENDNKPEIFITIVAPEVKRYMRSGHKRLEIVAKCTPCQCCACR